MIGGILHVDLGREPVKEPGFVGLMPAGLWVPSVYRVPS